MSKLSSAVLLLALVVACASPGQVESPTPEPRRGPYLGESEPGDRPVLFAPGLVSTDLGQRDTAISPDGNLLLYTVWGGNEGTLVALERKDGVWSDPRVSPLSGRHSDIEPAFDPAGSRLYFATKRPLPGETDPGDWNVWYAERDRDSWADPVPVDAVNQEGGEYYPSVTRTGTIYFTAAREDSIGGEDIFLVRREEDGYGSAENLGPAINSEGPEFNAYVDPDESLILFSSLREGDEGGGDLYVSFRGEDGSWSEARALGPEVNSPQLDYCPFLTPDGEHLFFSSRRTGSAERATPRDYATLVRELRGPSNGQGSLYWVDARVLERLRPQ